MTRGVGARTSNVLQYGFFTFLFVGTSVLAFFLFKPFLTSIFLALILSVVCFPFYKHARTVFGERDGLAASATILVVLTLIIAPAVFFGLLLFREVTDIYVYLMSPEGKSTLFRTVVALEGGVRSAFPGFAGFDQYADVSNILEYSLRWIAEHLGGIFTGIFTMALKLVLMFLALSFFLREGENIMQKLVQLSPLKNDHDEMILKKIALSINTVLKGRLVIAIIQGLFAGIGFTIFGVPNPVFFGFLTAFCSLVPTVGTSLVMVPAVLYLFFTGAFPQSLMLLAWGLFAVGIIDDILGPYLIERGMKIHPFLILISALGGLKLFGPIGVIAGPVLIAVLFVLGEIYIILTRSVEKTVK